MRATCQWRGRCSALRVFSRAVACRLRYRPRAIRPSGLDGGEYNDDKPDGYWRADAAPTLFRRCTSIIVTVSALTRRLFPKHS